MKRSPFTTEPIIGVLREHGRRQGWRTGKDHGVAEHTIYSWKAKHGT